MREQIQRILTTPHELLHALALSLIGRRAGWTADDHVVIPDDLTTREYVFVTGLPALVMLGVIVVALILLFNASTPSDAGIATGVIIVAAAIATGTISDLRQILSKLSQRSQ